MVDGVVAIGDSITAACSADLVYGGVQPSAWAAWVADTAGLPLTTYAQSGASSSLIRRKLLPEVHGTYVLGLVYVGVNNIASAKSWRADDLAEDVAAIVGRLRHVAERVVVLSPPDTLGVAPGFLPYGPGLRRRRDEAQRVIEAVGGSDAVRVPPQTADEVWLDGVHPTSLGHLRMADAAARHLGLHVPSATAKRDAVRRADFRAWRRAARVRFITRHSWRGSAVWVASRAGRLR